MHVEEGEITFTVWIPATASHLTWAQVSSCRQMFKASSLSILGGGGRRQYLLLYKKNPEMKGGDTGRR